MKFRRTGSALLAAALAATSMGIYASAAEDEAMKTELTYVKQRIDIPEEYSEFSYRTTTENNSTRYNFTWEKKDSTNGERITVGITGKVIKNIYVSEYDPNADWRPSFAKLSDAKLKAALKSYIEQINPTIKNSVEVDEDSFSISLYGNEANMSFRRVVNGVPVTGQTGSVTVNKNTGKLVRYKFNWTNGAAFSDTKNAISVKDAQKAYKELFPVELVYTLSYDWETEEQTPHLIYSQTKSGQINAFTGKLSTYEDYNDYGTELTMAEESEADMDANPGAGGMNSAAAVKFTDAEIEKLEKEDSLIKAEKEMETLKKQGIFFIPEGAEVSYQNCSYNDRLGYYIRNVSFVARSSTKYVDLSGDGPVVPVTIAYDADDDVEEKEDYDIYGSFTYNAENGDLTSFWCYAPDNGTTMKSAASDKKANDFMKKLLGEKWTTDFGDLENSYDNKVYSKYDPNTGKPIGTPRITSKNYRADREAYGIRCSSENVSFTLSNNGYITSYNIRYYDDIEYPKPDNIISESKAYSSFFKQVDLGLRYRCAYRTDTKKVVTALVYAADSNLCIDAFTGKRTYADGSEYNELQAAGEYTDLDSSKYKAYAEKLKSYGVTLMDKDGKLNESQPITAGDFRELLQQIGMYIDDSIVKDTAKLNRQTAAKLLVTGRYGSEVAEMTSVFKTSYSDVKSNSKYIGYIAIADASGLLKGSGGKYYPTSAFTRGAALKLAYDYLSR